MRKWLSILMLGVLFAFPSLASAQSEITLGSVQVQLWPEYDQPSMLVINNFTVADGTVLPARITFRMPKEAHLSAVALFQNKEWLNAKFEDPTQADEWQVITIIVEQQTTYRFEYYQPLNILGNTRQFAYLWSGLNAVDNFTLSVQEPVDMTSLTSEPVLKKVQDENGIINYESNSVALAANEPFTINLQYEKSSDALTVPATPVQTAPIDETTNGRISLNSYLPYVLGGLGVVLIIGGLLYYFLSGRERGQKPRRRNRAPSDLESNSAVHCHQCGSRAYPNDRFCRICGARLRKVE